MRLALVGTVAAVQKDSRNFVTEKENFSKIRSRGIARPTDWTLLFDGKTVSLEPSIGNWSFPCQSHYYIRKNRVKWAPKWSREQIERGRRQDSHAKQSYFEVGEIQPGADAAVPETTRPKRSWWQAIKSWWS